MDLSVQDSAQLLSVSEKTIYRWVKQGKLPAYRVNEQYRFNRAELLEWATSQRVKVSADIFNEPHNGTPPVKLIDSLKAGGIHYRVGGKEKADVLHSVVELMPLPDLVDRQFLLQVLLARESLGSTAVGRGIALPHVRNPVVMHAVFFGKTRRIRGIGRPARAYAVHDAQPDRSLASAHGGESLIRPTAAGIFRSHRRPGIA
jgi:PTS system nitrogen regulatory IIA component